MTFRASTVPTNGIKLHIRDHGGDGPTLLLAHGLSANARFFDGLISAGLPDHARVITVDLRGRGLSDKPDAGYTMADHARDIVGILDELGIESVVMGGHSFGGLLTYYLATAHASRVHRCVALDAPINITPTIVKQIQPSLARLDTTSPSLESYLATIRRQPYFDSWWEPEIEVYYRADVEDLDDGSVRPRSRPHHIEQAVQGTLDPDWPALVSRIEQPTLIVRARGSFGPPGSPPIVDSGQAAELIDTLPNGQLVEVDGNHITAFFGAGAKVVADTVGKFVREDA